MNNKTINLALAALFAAITSICSIITVPLGFTPVPVNLGTLGMFLCGGLLDKKNGVVSMCVYVFMGAAGIPVFAGFRAGPGVLAGPTGGYILGYILGVFIIGLLLERFPCKKNTIVMYGTVLSAGLITCYLCGTAWFVISTESTIYAALISCVLPFIAGDLLKIFIAAILIRRILKVI